MTEKSIMHYGVPGMRWGKRGAAAKGGSGEPSKREAKKAARAERDKSIETARSNMQEKTKELDRAAAATYTAKTETGRRRAEAQYDRLERDFFESPDFQTSLQATRGEQIANRINTGIIVGLSAAAIGINIAGASVARR